MDKEILEQLKTLTTIVGNLEEKIGGVQSNLESKIDNVQSGLEGKITSIQSNLENKIVSVESSLENKIGGLQSNLENKIASVEKSLRDEMALTKRDLGVLIEHQNDKIAILAEQVADIPKLREEVRGMGVRLERVEGKVDGVADYLQNNLDPRVARLEDLISEKEYAQ